MNQQTKVDIIAQLEDATLVETMEIISVNMRSFNTQELLQFLDEINIKAKEILSEKLAKARYEVTEAEKSLGFARELETTLMSAVDKI